MHFSHLSLAPFLAGAALLLAGTAAPAAGTYLALGDSYAYGFTTVADAYNPLVEKYDGLQGYVPPVGAAFGAQKIINLAIPGETTGSFLSGGNVLEEANTNYAAPYTDSQASKFSQVVQAETAAGHTISDITIQLGGNDLQGAVFADPTFLSKSQLDKEAFVAAQLQTLGANYSGILGAIHANSALANTQVYVVGYFDPFADLGAQDPFGLDSQGNQLSGDFVQALNSTLKADANTDGFHFVDPYSAFRNASGNHDDLSYIKSPLGGLGYVSTVPNFHPKAAGYALLAQQIETAAAVPESSTTVSFGLLLSLGAVIMAAKRRKKAE